MLLSALSSAQARTWSASEMLISSGSAQTNSGVGLKSSDINPPKTEETFLTKAMPQNFSVYDGNNFSEIVRNSMLCSFILTYFRCSSAQRTGIHLFSLLSSSEDQAWLAFITSSRSTLREQFTLLEVDGNLEFK